MLIVYGFQISIKTYVRALSMYFLYVIHDGLLFTYYLVNRNWFAFLIYTKDWFSDITYDFSLK